jgi:hypothetical protein
LANAFSIARSSSSGTVGLMVLMLGTGSTSCRAITAWPVGPVNGGSPTNISYNTQPTAGLLGTHVCWGPQREARLGEALAPGLSQRPSDPEVRHDCLAFLEQDVLGLDVAVDHSLAVGVVQGAGYLAGELYGFFNGELGLPIQLLAQGLPWHVGHDVEEEPFYFS